MSPELFKGVLQHCKTLLEDGKKVLNGQSWAVSAAVGAYLETNGNDIDVLRDLLVFAEPMMPAIFYRAVEPILIAAVRCNLRTLQRRCIDTAVDDWRTLRDDPKCHLFRDPSLALPTTTTTHDPEESPETSHPSSKRQKTSTAVDMPVIPMAIQNQILLGIVRQL